MRFTDIFNEVVSIMKNDSATIKDVSGADPEIYRKSIYHGMDEDEFLLTVKKYLASFGVPGHVDFFRRGKARYAGFGVRRYKNELYVAFSDEEEVPVGSKITALDGLTVEAAAEKFSPLLYGEPEERQGYSWGEILSFSREIILIAPSGEKKKIKIKLRPRPPAKNPYSFKRLNDETGLLTLKDFFDGEKIGALIDSERGEIEKCRNLVIDVRDNCGGSDTSFVPLLPLTLKEDDPFLGKIVPSPAAEVNYTRRNSESRLKLLKEYRRTAPTETLALFDREIERQTAMAGRGFVREDEDFCFPKIGTALPERVFVLADAYTASSGEAFVEVVSALSKTTVVGRRTMGILDYSNVAEADFGEYALVYPTSRRIPSENVRGENGKRKKGEKGEKGEKGVPVDEYIPWTPSHIFEDADLKRTLDIIDGGNKG